MFRLILVFTHSALSTYYGLGLGFTVVKRVKRHSPWFVGTYSSMALTFLSKCEFHQSTFFASTFVTDILSSCIFSMLCLKK